MKTVATHGPARAMLSLACAVLALIVGAVSASADARTHDSSTSSLMAVPSQDPTLMAVPDEHASLMPIPGGASSATAHDESDEMSGMNGMDSHGSDDTMRAVATPDAPTRHAVLAGFATVNLLVLGVAAYRRRSGAGRQRRSDGAPSHTPRSGITDGGAR